MGRKKDRMSKSQRRKGENKSQSRCVTVSLCVGSQFRLDDTL